MNIKDLIVKVRREYNLIIFKQEELERLESLCGICGISYEEKVKSTSNNKRVEQNYLNYIEFKDELSEFILKAQKSRKLLSDLIDKLDTSLQIKIMYQYCMMNKSLKEIAVKENYTRQAIYKIYRSALDIMQKELTEVDKR